jgi:AcrR family transcriptional regulator
MSRTPAPGTRDALLDAARAEFSRRGLDRARVEDIARRAGISKGAFYLHFRTKEEAFREIVQRYLGALADHADRRDDVEDRLTAPAAAPGPADLARLLEAECGLDADLLELFWRNRQITAAMLSARRPPYRRLVADFRARMQSRLAGRLAERQRAGLVRPDLDVAAVADIVVGAYEDLARRMIDLRQRPDLVGWARSFLVLVYEGILPRPAARLESADKPPLPPRSAGQRKSGDKPPPQPRSAGQRKSGDKPPPQPRSAGQRKSGDKRSTVS